MRSQFDRPLEPDVLDAARRRDPRAQEAIYRAYARAVYALARRLCGAAGADDVLQDTFVDALARLGQYRGEAPFGAWLRRIAANTALMRLRRERRLVALDGDWHAAMPAPEAQLADRFDLEAALDRLPGASRAVVWLHDVEGLTHAEIGAAMGMTASFSKSQLARAHARLREWLQWESNPDIRTSKRC